MQKSYVKVDRQRGRVIRIEIDPHLGELLYSEPVTTKGRVVEMISDPILGHLLIVLPDAPGNPRATAGPPLSRSTAGER